MSTRTHQSIGRGAAGNSSRRSQRIASADKGGANILGTGISFTAGATIEDSGNGFGALAVGDRIEVEGSPANSRRFTLTAAAAGSLTVVPAVLTTEAAGAAIRIRRL